jgi:hypothetical protein
MPEDALFQTTLLNNDSLLFLYLLLPLPRDTLFRIESISFVLRNDTGDEDIRPYSRKSFPRLTAVILSTLNHFSY